MDLEVARKALSKRGAFSSKRMAFLAVAGLCLVAGILLRAGQYFGEPKVEQNAPVEVAAPPPPAAATSAVPETPPPAAATSAVPQIPPPAQETATAPNAQTEQTGAAVEQAGETGEQPELPASGTILVSRQPVAVLASPSASAPALYGFPAGRPFRVIGRDGGFAHIQDLRSSASGWIDEAALALPPSPRVPAASAPSQPKPSAVGRKPASPSAGPKPKATKKDSQVTADSEPAAEEEPVETRKRPGIFGRGGLFGGIFSNGN